MATTNTPTNYPAPDQNNRDPKEVPEPTPVQEPKPHDNVASPPPPPVRMQAQADMEDQMLPDAFDSFKKTDTSKLNNSDYAAGGHEVKNAKEERAPHLEKLRDATPSTNEVAQPHTPFAANEVGLQYGSGHVGKQYERPVKPTTNVAIKKAVHRSFTMDSDDTHHGQNYENWRINQIAKLDRNYAELRRDHMYAS
jgi:hypothetical protein